MLLETIADRRHAFGSEARRFIARFPASVSLIAAEALDSAAIALARAAQLRRDGIAFYAAPLVDEPRAYLAQMVSGKLLERATDFDVRRSTFDALANEQLTIDGVSQAAYRLVDGRCAEVLRDLVILGDSILARSSRDLERIARLVGYRRRFVISPGRDESVPKISSRQKKHIVVWAPHLTADRLGVIAMAVDLLKEPAIYVCASGELPAVRGRFISISEAHYALENASCVVDAQISDPATAIALAERGFAVIAAATSGGSEFLDGLYEYDPWSFRSIHAAITRGRAAAPPVRKMENDPAPELTNRLVLTSDPGLRHGPLVSVVLPTYNRRALLPSCLERFAKQTYSNLDVIVVNDGGVDVSDICSQHDFVRLMSLDKNVGAAAAMRAGMDWIKGKYFAFWGDDDIYFPDHFSRVVSVLEHTGDYVAHAQTLTRYYIDDGDVPKTRAYKVLHDRPNDAVEMLAGPTMSLGMMLFRREVLDGIGYLDPAFLIVDAEYQMRASEKYDFAQVDVVTGQWDYNMQQKTYTHAMGCEKFLADQKKIYEKYPTTSTLMNARRSAWLKQIEECFDSVLWPPNMYLPPDFCD